ncbi:MAG TPA: mercuric transporter MerT family protein [Candidatus Cybelea sp.]|nr:mercuric transporter MerT family protein [Candidatus Cybelea sp.]
MSSRQTAAAVGAAGIASGSALTAGVAAACCVGPSLAPLLLPVLGATGLITIAMLRPYTIWLDLFAALMLAFSFRQVYRRRTACAPDGAPAIPTSLRVARIVTWVAAGLWILSLFYALYGFSHE